MARPKSEDKRNAIMAAAVRVIASQGLGAPTATIAREARIANGSLFNYFETKGDLLNQLYLALKAEVYAAALDGCPARASLRQQAFHVWSRWTAWAVAAPDKRKTLALLCVCDDISPQIRAAAQPAGADIAALIGKCAAKGPLKDQPQAFVLAVVEALSGATMDFMIAHPKQARQHCEAGFNVLWRAIA